MTTQFEIGVIGAGNAAEGIIHGVLRNSMLMDDRIIAADMNDARRQAVAQKFKIETTADNVRVVENSYILMISVKPQQFEACVADFADKVTEEQIIVSIMAGVSCATIEAAFPKIKARVVRIMPNLASHVGEGMAGVFAGQHATDADLLRAQRIIEAGGKSVHIEDEALMDAVTAIAGSGPAYFYFFTEALVEAGKKAGLSEQYAGLLAKQTALGAAQMMLESGDSPATLREKVTSKGGTTYAALESMRQNGVFDHIMNGALAAYERAKELGEAK